MEGLKKSFLVIKPAIARKLLKMGFHIIDIRPQKQEDGTMDSTRCAFVFENREGLKEIFESLK